MMYIYKIEPRAPLVGLELFEGEGHFLAPCLFCRVKMTSEVVVQLDVLRLNTDG